MSSYIKIIGFYITFLILVSACGGGTVENEMESQNIHSLPMTSVSLDDLQEFRNPAGNWMISGDVQSDYSVTSDMKILDGTGALVNIPTDEHRGNLYTEFEHGDIELSLEFLVPKGSNSGLYFQGRYELQILDSWRKTNPTYSDAGGIYERWNEEMPEEERGFEGKAPDVNASLAPGLWQTYRVLFRAPRFNDAGDKIENARFEEVYLNGALIHKDVELSGPTRGAISSDETSNGPLMIQGDHGPVAFRDIEYKLYEQKDSLELSPLEYKVYDYNGDRTPQNFDTLELLKEGTTDSFNVASISPKNEHYATHFSGELSVPVSGDYLFETQMDNGGNLFIDGELILENTGELEGVRPGKIVNLEEGTHQLEVTHFQINWSTYVTVYYEGPNMEKRTLASKPPWGDGGESEPLTVDRLSDRPEIIGGFTNYNDEKRTHTLSVGFDEGIHYSYDLQAGALLKFWRDPFADLSQMWVGRGHEQLLVPMNAAVEEKSGSPLLLDGSGFDFFKTENDVRMYSLNKNGEPVFRSGYGGITVDDYIHPAENAPGFIRTITYSSDIGHDTVSARIAQSRSIEKLSESLFRIDGRYYLEVIKDGGEAADIIETNAPYKALIIPVLQNNTSTEIEYRLIW
jgi:hypothetical protein